MNIQPNLIPQVQNESVQIDHLAAISYLYSQAKCFLAIQIILTILIPITLTIVSVFLSKLRIWATFYGVTISIIDAVLLEHLTRSFKEQAAKIQELFDCEVLKLDWHKLKIGSKPDHEAVEEAATKFKSKNPDLTELKNWYPENVGKLPLYAARVVCQRENCLWDSKLRQKYTYGLTYILAGAIIIVFIIGFATGMNMEKFILAVLAPISPFILWTIREYKKQRESLTLLDRLKAYVEGLWSDVIAKKLPPKQIEVKSRELQDEIYDHRCNDPLIFNWIYRLLRTQYEGHMNKGAEKLVEDALVALDIKGVIQ